MELQKNVEMGTFLLEITQGRFSAEAVDKAHFLSRNFEHSSWKSYFIDEVVNARMIKKTI